MKQNRVTSELLQFEKNHDTICLDASFVDMRTPDGKLAFRFDPVRLLVEWQDKGKKHLFDLASIARPAR